MMRYYSNYSNLFQFQQPERLHI